MIGNFEKASQVEVLRLKKYSICVSVDFALQIDQEGVLREHARVEMLIFNDCVKEELGLDGSISDGRMFNGKQKDTSAKHS